MRSSMSAAIGAHSGVDRPGPGCDAGGRSREVEMPSLRPVYQFQGPKSHCVIDNLKLGWVSCTAYSMAMLIDGATGGEHQPAAAGSGGWSCPRMSRAG